MTGDDIYRERHGDESRDDLSFMTCTCSHNQTFHWAHRGACEACACLFFKLREVKA